MKKLQILIFFLLFFSNELTVAKSHVKSREKNTQSDISKSSSRREIRPSSNIAFERAALLDAKKHKILTPDEGAIGKLNNKGKEHPKSLKSALENKNFKKIKKKKFFPIIIIEKQIKREIQFFIPNALTNALAIKIQIKYNINPLIATAISKTPIMAYNFFYEKSINLSFKEKLASWFIIEPLYYLLSNIAFSSINNDD